MPENLSRASDSVLCLEVWLGPMEGARHLEPVPAARDTIVRVGRRRSDEKRGLENQFVLSEGEGISSFHAELRCSGGKIFLKDLKSTNGSFVRNKPVIGEVPIESGEIFLLSTTPIRADLAAEPRTQISIPERSIEELTGSPPLSRVLDKAAGAARGRGETFVDTRHLAEAILRGADPAVEKAFSRAKVSREDAIAAIWRGGLYRGATAWLTRFLATPVAPHETAGGPVFSPRVRQCASAAAGRLAAFSASEAESLVPIALLAAILSRNDSAVGSWLAENAVRAEMPSPPRRSAGRKTVVSAPALARPARPAKVDDATVAATRLRREAAAARAAERVEEETALPAALEEPGPPRGSEAVFATTGDVVLDQRARQIAIELEEAATLYRFSTPEDRRGVMKALVNRSLAAIAPENRTRILSQIRVQFPVVGAPPPAEANEVPRLVARVQELEHRLERAKTEKPAPPPERGASGDVPWKTLLTEPSGDPPPEEGQDLSSLRALVSFARHMEKFLLGLVQAVTVPGDSTMSFRLPGRRYTLEGLLSALEQGKPVDTKNLSDYLRELERWQVAILAAHHESARLWFEKHWKRVSPGAIENSTEKGGAWKIRGEAAEWWSRYKESVKGLTPDVVQDQVLQSTFRLAQEEFDKLSKRRQS
jgi:hypothetical protein